LIVTAEIDGVLFDFGRTLFDSVPETVLLAREAERLGADLTPDQVGELWAEIHTAAMAPEEVARGRDLDAAVWAARWKALYGLADRVLPGLGSALDAAMPDPATWVPYRDAVPTLEALHAAGTPVAVVSNTGWDIRSPFRARGLDHLVDAWVLSCEVGAAKPDTAIFIEACRRLGTEPAHTLMVGDDAVADGGATRAGLPVWLVAAGAPLGDDNGLDVVPRLLAR
jgi:putative hydrolase of the HAD superfamily